MRAHPYLLAVAAALLAACSDSTGPDLSTAGTAGTTTAESSSSLDRPASARPVPHQ